VEVAAKEENSALAAEIIEKEKALEGIQGIDGAQAIFEDGSNVYIVRVSFS
jgi:hypothetical protein